MSNNYLLCSECGGHHHPACCPLDLGEQVNIRTDEFKLPDYKYECELFGIKNWLWHTETKPNWFWRKMQYICFGMKWRKCQD